jgi:hypothetical protein
MATSNFAYDKGVIIKSTILIAMLATLVACNSEKKSSNACTFNSELSVCVTTDAGISATNKITNSLFSMM